MAALIAGLVVIGVGVILVLLGIVFSWQEFQSNHEMGATGFVKALKDLVVALAGQDRSVVCFAFGTLLVFLGGVIAGIGGLATA